MPFYKICVFSDVKGRVVMDGKPVVGATMRRSYLASNDEKGFDVAKTDAEGRFSFPAIWKFSLTAWMEFEGSTVHQEITIEHGGATYIAYRLTKGNYELNGELPDVSLPIDYKGPGRRKILLMCDISTTPTTKESRGVTTLYGLCTVVTDEQL